MYKVWAEFHIENPEDVEFFTGQLKRKIEEQIERPPCACSALESSDQLRCRLGSVVGFLQVEPAG